ncbi:MAG: DUF3293 domain-containing protein [Deinococcus sp.]
MSPPGGPGLTPRERELRPHFLGSSYGPVSTEGPGAEGSGEAGGRFGLGEEAPAGRSLSDLPGEEPASWAILTAWNPGGEQADPERNRAAQLELRAALSGYAVRDGRSGEGVWAEEALIVSGLSLGRARARGWDFGQAAVLWGSGRRVALVWCGSGLCERFWQR